MHWDTEPSLQPAAESQPLAPPNFADETTLRSARPVVPLYIAIKSPLRPGFLVLAFVLLVLTGGTLIQLGRGLNRPPQSLSTSADSADSTEPLPGEAVSPEQANKLEVQQASTGSDSNKGMESPTPARLPELGLKTARENAQRQTDKTGVASSTRRINAADQLESSPDDRISRRVRREARRLEVNKTRNAAGNGRGTVDGVFRIEEIFEGSERP